MPKIDVRPVDVIMRANSVRLFGEAVIRYPYSLKSLKKLRAEKRIRTIGTPPVVICSEFEEQERKGFPVIEGLVHGARDPNYPDEEAA